MELLVVIVILGILISFGMLAIRMMKKDHAQRKIPPSIFLNLKTITGEVLARTPAPEPLSAEGFISNEKMLPSFEDGSFCSAISKVMNVRSDKVNCDDSSVSLNGDTAKGKIEMGNGMTMVGVSSSKKCWDGRECAKVYVSIKKDKDKKPLFKSAGSINDKGEISNSDGPVDHFGFNIYRNGDVEPMITSVSSDGTGITTYGIAADMVTVNVIIDSVDPIYNSGIYSLEDKINALNSAIAAGTGDLKNGTKGDKPLYFHNTESLSYFLTEGGKKSEIKTYNNTGENAAKMFVQRQPASESLSCEYGLVCRVGFSNNPISLSSSGIVSDSQEVTIPDYRERQLNDANVLYFKIPYRRALAVKNYLEGISYTAAGISDICSSNTTPLLKVDCVNRRIASLKEYDIGTGGSQFLRDGQWTIDSNAKTFSGENYRTYYSTYHPSFYNQTNDTYINGGTYPANKRKALRLIKVSLR